jgi:N-formylmaleamate deformylase
VAQALESDYDIVAYDARYHGLSDAPAHGPIDRMAMMHDLEKVVAGLKLERPALMGHSMGAMTVMLAAAANPRNYRCTIMEDPPCWLGEPPSRPVPPEVEQTEEALIAAGRVQSPMWDAGEFGPWARAKLQLRVPAAGRGSILGTPVWREAVPKLQLPSLLICGGNEGRGRIVTREVSHEMRKLNPQIQAITFPEAGHNVRREAFEGFVDAVKVFLRKTLKS